MAKFDAQWMDVRVTDRRGYRVQVVTVRIRRKCPRSRCHGVRTRPAPVVWYEGRERIVVDRWDLSCGHVDLYCDVLRESQVEGGSDG